jgi:hypothetical protein
MQTTTLIGILAVVLAMVAYSIGTWSAFRSKVFKPFNLSFLWAGVVLDILATLMMLMSNGGKFKLDPLPDLIHTVLALVAFFGMLVLTAMGTWAYIKRNGGLQATLAKAIVAPWALWAAVFVWGMANPPKPG